MTMDFAQAINLLSAAATSVAAILIYIQIKSDRAWARLETSHNILNEFVSGKLEDTLELIERKLGWDILHDNRAYDEVTRNMSPADIDELDRLLRRLFRRFEAICISMDHRIVNEATCREYIFSLLLTLYASSKPFIDKERSRRKEPRVFQSMEKYAAKWQKLGRTDA
jgi:hypothetical protein